ncbi:MAG: biotin--[acetyl-CoA-carboxylase] ligase [Anaerolineae bacterium]|nr:biotin--[acetyl-CoA-carboxylase] ligase [Anaerolineae bacterium]
MSELSAAAIESALTTAWLGRPVHHFIQLGSTNDLARELARRGAAEGTLVIAEEQTAGKGRLGRSWWAPPGSCLLLSLIFRPPLAPAQAQRLTMIAGLACAEAVEAQTGLRPGLKWPNDLVLAERKLAGILTELETAGERLDFAVVGLGLNVNVDFRQQATDAELRDSAIGLLQVLGRPVDRLALLNELLVRLEQRYERLRAGQSPHAEWAACLVTLGQAVRVVTPSPALPPTGGGVLEGQAVGVDADGALLLRLADGRTERVLAGDVTLHRG